MTTLHFALRSIFFCILFSAVPAWSQTDLNNAIKPSVFAKDDLSKIQSGQILGKRNTMDQLAGVMSVQNCFLVPKDPAHVAGVLLNWNPTSYPELGIMVHEKIAHPPVPQNFSRLAFDPSKSYVKGLIDNSSSQSPNGGPLNLSSQESAKLQAGNQGPNALALAWQGILLDRVANFQTAGISQALPYETGDPKVSLQKEIQKLIREIPGITQNFSTLLGVAFNNPNGPKLAESYYWELIQVERTGTLLLGAVFETSDPSSGKIQVADFQYYVSNSFSSALILYDLIPTTVQGQPGTLVWRTDFVFIPTAVAGSGMERMATENILLLEVQKAVKRLQKDAS